MLRIAGESGRENMKLVFLYADVYVKLVKVEKDFVNNICRHID